MAFYRRIPGPLLGTFVEMLWLAEEYEVPHSRERLLPTGTMELVINLKADRHEIFEDVASEKPMVLSGGIVCGTQSKIFVIGTEQQEGVIGVHFRPGGAFPFLGCPAGELQETHVSLESLWGREGHEMRARVLEAPTPSDRLKVLEQCLLERVRTPLVRHPAVTYALRELSSGSGRPLSDLLESVGYSRRHFIELFRDEVGLTPKLFQRICRFQQVIERLQGPPCDWAELAMATGYYDQAHFIADFKAFSGLRPTQYQERRGEHLKHVPL